MQIQLDGGKMIRLAARCWTSMDVHMTFESEGLSEAMLTDITHKRLLGCFGGLGVTQGHWKHRHLIERI